MSKKIIALLMGATIFMSGVAGYAGSVIGGVAVKKSEASKIANQNVNNEIKNKSMENTTASNSANIGNTSTKTSNGSLSIEKISKMNENSVVEIKTEGAVTDQVFGQFISDGAGSGVIMTNDGYIVTNNHVVEKASKITAVLKDGKKYDAKLIGTDSKTDLAVIKINAVNLIPATPGDSSTLEVGELAVAIGNPLGELGGTVTEGIISALDREINIKGRVMNLLQTSAAINPGNSGGGLFDKNGKLVGIVNAKSFGSNIEGLGFAIPVNTTTKVVSDIITYGYVKGRKTLGISIVDVDSEQRAQMLKVDKKGVYINKTTKENGFKAGDRIIDMNGTKIEKSSQVLSIMNKLKVGDKVEMNVERNGATTLISLILEEDKN